MRNVETKTIVKRALSARDERGVILLVVLAMLQLLALIGLTFTVYAARGGPADAIARVEQEIERAQTALTALLENPDDVSLRESALVSVGNALWESSAITDGSETRTPETQRLDGLLHAAHALFERLVALLREPRTIHRDVALKVLGDSTILPGLRLGSRRIGAAPAKETEGTREPEWTSANTAVKEVTSYLHSRNA